ncbi:AraC family transcriptional regulator [Saccharopolyspora gregorii]|uniref:Helix-turn-helix domain-containing protein n=1 Tax=Saccharopolyspora gregorii TaxID=33914 RepID=A0ABP6S216_9PSEU
MSNRPDPLPVEGPRRASPVEAEFALATADLPWSVRIPPPADGFRASLHRHRIDDLALVECATAPFSGVRGARQLAGTDGDFVVVLLVDAGGVRFEQGGAEWSLVPGDVLVWDSRRPARCSADRPLTARSLVVPRGILDDVGCPLRVGEPAGGRVPGVRLLRGYLDALHPVLPELPAGSAVAARNALLELVWGALHPGTPLDPLALLPARRAAVERYLDERLGSSGLSAEEVAAAHNISVRTLGRLFAEVGETFSGVLRAKRIARVREGLLTGDVTIAALARRWGFFDTSHLNRRFRAVHGVSPHEYRRGHQS